jgi:hypothetical protein
MNLLTALLNRPYPEIRLDDYPDRPLSNGERRALWAGKWYPLREQDRVTDDEKEVSNESEENAVH